MYADTDSWELKKLVENNWGRRWSKCGHFSLRTLKLAVS